MTFPSLPRRRLLGQMAAAGAAPWLMSLPAHAQAWPKGKNLALVVGYPPGGATDVVARAVADGLAARLGTSVTVENLGGAGGSIAAQKVVRAAPDGYTLLLGACTEVSIARMINPAIKYNGETDLAHIGFVGTTPLVWVVGAQVGVKTAAEAVALIQKSGDKYSFASPGIGTQQHIAGEYINNTLGGKMKHVPYRGGAQIVTDMMGGVVEFSVFSLPSVIQHLESGKLVALGVATPQRLKEAPNIPSLSETPQLKNMNLGIWYGLFGPAGLPRSMIATLNSDLNDTLKSPEINKRLERAGVTAQTMSPTDLSRYLTEDTRRVQTVIASIPGMAEK